MKLQKDNKAKGISLTLLSVFLFLFLFNFISAQPPFQSEDTFITIDYTKKDVYQQNQNVLFNFFVTNTTTGLKLTNTSIACQFNLFNHQGNQILTNHSSSFHIAGQDFENNISAGNFTQSGEYAFHIYCFNGTTVGGTLSSAFTVTPSGRSGNENIYFYLFIIIALYTITFLGLREGDEWITALGGMAMMGLGVYMINEGIIIYQDWITNYFAYLTIGLGFIATIKAIISGIDR